MHAVFKVRKPLVYRLPVLDDAIRRQRTVREAEIMHRVKTSGVSAPFIYDVDVPSATLVMEFIDGERVRDLIGDSSAGAIEGIFEEFGRSVAKMHSSGIMHGDLTTANVVRRRRSLVFLDFGLSVHSSKVEDHAVDLRLIKETLVGAHPEVSSRALDSLFLGYASGVGQKRSRAVFKQLQNIERRGRYARVA
jgi:TP53 regulating kinase-like protein